MSNPVEKAVAALPPLREVIAAHDLGTRKALGQNFLLDLNLTAKIARHAGPLTEGTVVEVGPGPGGLTRALLAAGARNLVAIEKDPRCVVALMSLLAASDGRLTVRQDDALAVALTELGPPPVRVVANLPYNIATPLLIGWLLAADQVSEMILMFQREVADRIVASEPGITGYSRLSVLCNWRCETRMVMTLPPSAFTPPPKVSSAVVSLTPRRPTPDDCDTAALERVTQAAFGQRRKMLRGSLKTLGGDPTTLLALAKIDGTRRAEDLTIAEFARLAVHLPS